MDYKRDVRALEAVKPTSTLLGVLCSPVMRSLVVLSIILGSAFLALFNFGMHTGVQSQLMMSDDWKECVEPSQTVVTVTKTVQVVVTVPVAPVTIQQPDGASNNVQLEESGDGVVDGGRKNAFDSIYSKQGWGDGESLSGTGSYLSYTVNARRFLSAVLRTFNLQKILDSPCGDCNWQWAIPEVRGGTVDYTGIDIVQNVILGNTLKHIRFPNMRFAAMDFVSREDVLLPQNTTASSEPAPLWEVINCRDALQHINVEDGVKAVHNFERSGAKYLVTGWYTGAASGAGNSVDGNIPAGYFYQIMVGTTTSQPNMKMIGVWKLPAFGLGDGTTISPNMTQMWEWWENPSAVRILEGDPGQEASSVNDPGFETIVEI
ncbi:hypothetical protein HDU93_006285 [Gonapodya sp. JEL0774]|nr:hypothetical protein HDU93_006285 [Gonapodya sp. JEL0774]